MVAVSALTATDRQAYLPRVEPHTHVVEGAAAGRGDLEQSRVDEWCEGRGRLVFGHGVALGLRLADRKAFGEKCQHAKSGNVFKMAEIRND